MPRFENPYQLLVATILSAQSTDETVNKITPAVFERYPTPADLAHANPTSSSSSSTLRVSSARRRRT